MNDPFQLNALLSDTSSTWSLRVAEKGYPSPDHGINYHCFMILVKDGPQPEILFELHFIPVTENGISINRFQPDYKGKPLLGANVYKDQKAVSALLTKTYAEGSPQDMLTMWNCAMRAALDVSKQRREFVTGHCRTGVKATIESLGLKFEHFTNPRMTSGVEFDLTVSPYIPDPTRSDPATLVSEFCFLHGALNSPRVT